MSEEDEEIQWLIDQKEYLEHKKQYKAWFASLMKKYGELLKTTKGDEEE
tara:strand:+ start:121 stop:267 length:147 start_codon:yes stop_codon:yes gene_type:complete